MIYDVGSDRFLLLSIPDKVAVAAAGADQSEDDKSDEAEETATMVDENVAIANGNEDQHQQGENSLLQG